MSYQQEEGYLNPPPYNEQTVVYQPHPVPVQRVYVMRDHEAERRAAEDRDIADTAADACCAALCAALCCFCLFCEY